MARFVSSLRSLFSTPTPEAPDPPVASDMVTTRRGAAAQRATPDDADADFAAGGGATPPKEEKKRKPSRGSDDVESRATRGGDAGLVGGMGRPSPPLKRKRASPEVATAKEPTSPAKGQASLPERLRGQDQELPAAEPSRTHIRFGSASPPPTVPRLDQLPTGNTVEDNGHDSEDQSSGDEAPEAVTLENAAEETRAREAHTTKAKEKARMAKRDTHRALTQRLQEQAAKSTSRQQKTRANRLRPSLPDETPVPDLLPAELLAAAPAERPLTPPPVTMPSTADLPSKHTRLDVLGPKKQKVVKRGPVGVQVLPQASRLLAPKASRQMKRIKQEWLNRKAVPSGKMERRPVGTKGFMRG